MESLSGGNKPERQEEGSYGATLIQGTAPGVEDRD